MKKIMKIILLMFSVLFTFQSLSAQEEADSGIDRKANSEKTIEDRNDGSIHSKDNLPIQRVPSPFGFYIGSKFGLNKLDDEGLSTPFEATISLGFEYEYILKYFAIQPSCDLSFFHYLWTGILAAHSESENRTAFTIALTLELPLMFVIDIKRWSLSFGGSIACVCRVSALDLGIRSDEQSSLGTTAKEEVKHINAYHWQGGRFFYPAIRCKGEYTLENGWKVGLLFSAYLPVFNTWAKSATKEKVPFLHDSIFNIAFVIHPGKKN